MLSILSNPVVSKITNWMSFTDEADTQLSRVEARLFENFDIEYSAKYVPVRFKNSEIYTITINNGKEKNPTEAVVFIPGFGAGTAMWCANLKELSENHTIYIFDMIGFGRSSRPTFSSDPSIAELEMVESIEDWRKNMGIEKMHIVAHSFGAYIAAAYALEHSSRINHLILVDPWGFAEKVDANEQLIKPYEWMSFLGGVAGSLNPLSPMRWMGPFAPAIVQKLRPDLQLRFKSIRSNDIYKYVYLCNLPEPTGETAFMSMTLPVGWAKRPMIKRFSGIHTSVGVTFIYGSKSWIDPGPAMDIQSYRDGYVDIKVLRGAGHHVYADDPTEFNKIVKNVVEGRLEQPIYDYTDDE
ncbi:unnamed protein product [Caenorhabditis angaria]|uniref:AB hydrolase-1 domain-containing protein n=1 Tax=Caenorhabditis angaria TaxID=860376 RepID=A0A9P1MUQ7_9PELO|nr:unnamed protein product [Caenorhabditis angaria]